MDTKIDFKDPAYYENRSKSGMDLSLASLNTRWSNLIQLSSRFS